VHETGTKLLESRSPELLRQFGADLLDALDQQGDLVVVVKPSRIRDVVRFLKEDPSLRFDVMMDLFVVDYSTFEPATPERFGVIYNLFSLFQKGRIFLKVYVAEESPEIDSISDIYAAADWFEREAWDLFGVRFRNHPNLVRILCHTEFEGHPLRKDYPSTGYQRLKNAAPSSGF
jgi:NADH-quinone oxidoreductase subunit C